MNRKFKQTVIDKIPEDWVKKTLGELVTFQRGHDLPQRERKTGPYPIIASNGIVGYHNEYKAKGPGVTIGRSGNLGKPFYVDRDYWPHNTTLYSIEFHNSDPRFVYYFLKTMNLKNFNAGSAVPTLNRNHIHPIEVIIPKDILEQRAIAKILSDLDEKIELNHQMNQTLVFIAQAIFKHWFVDFEFPNDDGKPYKSSGGKMVKSELGNIPAGWEVRTCKEALLTIESGSRPKGGIGSYSEGIPSIGAENIFGLGQYDYPRTKYVPIDFYNQMTTGHIKSEDVLLYKDGAQLGRKSIFMDNFPFAECCINEHVFILRPKEVITATYLYLWLDQDWMTNEIVNLNANSAQPGINRDGVNSLLIIIPNVSVIKMFGNKVKPVFSRIFSNCLESNNLSQIRDSLLPKLMAGKIRGPVEVNQNAR